MAKFTLTSGAETFEFDTDGSVSQGNTKVGNWRTTPENKIQVKKVDGPSTAFDVGWKFNSDNQFILTNGSKEVFNFQLDQSVTPGFELRKGVLRFTPNRLSGFSFDIVGKWDLVGNHDLQFTINDRATKIVGFISDAEKKNRFLYIFRDNKRPLLLHRLQFEGHWTTPSPQKAALQFVREDGSGAAFDLPGDLVIEKTTNQLRYEYTKNGKKSFDFEGTLSVGPDFQITYVIARTQTQANETVVTESVIQIGAVFAKPNFTGNLEVTVRKADGSSATLTIAGSFTAVVGKDTKLAVGFKFDQVRSSGQVTSTTFGFAGQLDIKNKTTITWSFGTTNAATKTINLSIGADVNLGPASIDGRLNLTSANGQTQGVTFLLGVHF